VAGDEDGQLFAGGTAAQTAAGGKIAFKGQFWYKISKFELTQSFKISIYLKSEIGKLHESTDSWNYHG
jgi:hypothetical protein